MGNPTDLQNNIIDNTLRDFHSAMKSAGDLAWSRIVNELNMMEVNPDTNHLLNGGESIFNQQVNNDYLGQALLGGYNSQDYTNSIEAMKDSLEDLEAITREEYNANGIYLKEGENQYTYQRMVKGLITTIKNDIDAAFNYDAFAVKVLAPAIDSLSMMLNGSNTTRNAMLKDMEHRIADRFDTFGITSSTTIMAQFIRRLNEIYAKYSFDVNNEPLNWVKYDGVQDDRNREFCDDRLNEGVYFHVNEVKNWVDLYGKNSSDGGWDGMIPHTDKGSIFVNAGGYNCKHAFIYTTLSVVKKDNPSDIVRAKRILQNIGLDIYSI